MTRYAVKGGIWGRLVRCCKCEPLCIVYIYYRPLSVSIPNVSVSLDSRANLKVQYRG